MPKSVSSILFYLLDAMIFIVYVNVIDEEWIVHVHLQYWSEYNKITNGR